MSEKSYEELRQSRRVPIEVEVTLSSENNFYAGITGNISAGGVFVATYTPPATGTVVEMELKLPDGPPFLLSGEVCWVRDLKASCDGAPPGCGIRWRALPAEAMKAIEQFVERRDTLLFELDDAA
jgi:uncharacterized protein (TIGR02266 family)